MEVVQVLPQSVFNTQSDNMVKFLKKLNDQWDKNITLHRHQVQAVLKIHDYFNPQKNNMNNIALVVLPTGCGKTGVAVLASYALNASRVLVITPSLIISKQIYQEYGRFLIDHGVIPDKPEVTQTVLPTRSLIKRSSEIRDGMRSMVMVVNAHKIGGQSSMRIEDIPHEGYDLVIVDKAHHYPAPTWKLLVDHFSNSRRLFLTTTPEHRGKPILPIPPCYKLERVEAVTVGIIRDVYFDELTGGFSNEYRYQSIATSMEQYLDRHDQVDPSVTHQGMVLTQTKTGLNAAEDFCEVYNDLYPNKCAMYVSETRRGILEAFVRGEIRTLVIIGRLLEGFNHKPVSVLGIVRNIAPTSRVLFAQFVGKGVRKNSPSDPVPTQMVTHQHFNQLQNFETFEKLAEVDQSDDDN